MKKQINNDLYVIETNLKNGKCYPLKRHKKIVSDQNQCTIQYGLRKSLKLEGIEEILRTVLTRKIKHLICKNANFL